MKVNAWGHAVTQVTGPKNCNPDSCGCREQENMIKSIFWISVRISLDPFSWIASYVNPSCKEAFKQNINWVTDYLRFRGGRPETTTAYSLSPLHFPMWQCNNFCSTRTAHLWNWYVPDLEFCWSSTLHFRTWKLTVLYLFLCRRETPWSSPAPHDQPERAKELGAHRFAPWLFPWSHSPPRRRLCCALWQARPSRPH